MLTVAGFAFPKPHVAEGAGGIEMAKRLLRREVRGAEETEVGEAFADHMVAAVALEDGAVALWAWRSVIAQIGFGGKFFRGEFRAGRTADNAITVPAMGADAAEGKCTAATDLEFRGLGGAGVNDRCSSGSGGSGGDGFKAVVAEVVRGVVVSHRGVEGADALAARGLAPLPRTVHCCGVLLKRGFLLQFYVALHQHCTNSYLTQFIRWECWWEHYLLPLCRLHFQRKSLGRYRRCCGVVEQCGFLDTDWVRANDRRDMTFGNHARVVGLQTR